MVKYLIGNFKRFKNLKHLARGVEGEWEQTYDKHN